VDLEVLERPSLAVMAGEARAHRRAKMNASQEKKIFSSKTSMNQFTYQG